ncbi:MAG: hypothetical protein ICV86_17730 [Microcoleus sp. T3-bin5]|nr:hypothetical protein [Microcoleus sp. T3-bin5]
MIVACGVLTATFYNSEVSGAIARKFGNGFCNGCNGFNGFNGWILRLEVRGKKQDNIFNGQIQFEITPIWGGAISQIN